MLFNSYIFIFGFLPTTLLIFFSLTKFHLTKAAKFWLLIASLAFYSYWNITYLPLLLISIVVNYGIGRLICYAKPTSRLAKVLLGSGIFFNLGLLIYYKYTDFFINSFNQLFHTKLGFSQIILPLGISFYTFTQIAYLVDAYRNETKKYNFLIYSLFVTFFPHLIAGPILHHRQIIPQFYKLRNFVFSHENVSLGLTWFTLGLFKKVIIADHLSLWVAPVFDNANSVNFIEAWIGALNYTLQLYFDFSGYSDMAIGLGLMINIHLPLNFNSPYKATSIINFWRRWHITLSDFLRDYLYIPLGGNRKGEVRRYANLLITMLLGGIWHGAGWTFLLWGGLHGVFLSINHGWRKLSIPIPKLLAWLITFLAVMTSWVVFRAHSLPEAIALLQTMAGVKGIVLPGESQSQLSVLTQFGVKLKGWQELLYLPTTNGSKPLSLAIVFGLTFGVSWLPNTQQIVQGFKPNWWWATYVGVLASLCLLSLNRVSEFLYFQF